MSPGINPIENLWKILACHVYSGGQQFSNQKDLVECILGCWVSIEQSAVQALLHSMNAHAIEVLERQGGSTHY